MQENPFQKSQNSKISRKAYVSKRNILPFPFPVAYLTFPLGEKSSSEKCRTFKEEKYKYIERDCLRNYNLRTNHQTHFKLETTS